MKAGLNNRGNLEGGSRTGERLGWDGTSPETRSDGGEVDLERLKNELLRGELQKAPGAVYHAPLRRAANEAASLAWLEPWPLLVFPELFQERVRAAQVYVGRQGRIRAKTAALAEVAVDGDSTLKVA